MATFDDVKSWINTATMSEIESLMNMIKARRNLIGIQTGLSFKAGDRVFFDAKKRSDLDGFAAPSQGR